MAPQIKKYSDERAKSKEEVLRFALELKESEGRFFLGDDCFELICSLSVCLSVCLSDDLSDSVYLSVSLSVCVSVCVCLSV